MQRPVVVMKGDFTGISGYARCTRTYAESLFKYGINLFCQDHRKDGTGLRTPFWEKMLKERSVDFTFQRDITIWHETPQFWGPDNKTCINIGYTTFETTGICNRDILGNPQSNWVAQCNKMDLILVPCNFNKKSFQDSGVTTQIEVVPHIVHPPNPSATPFYEEKPDHMRLLSVFQWNPRKDPVTLLLGFWRANIKNTRLIMKTYGLEFDESNLIIIDKLQKMKKTFYEQPLSTINPVLNKLSDDEMDMLFKSADVYITTSKGEGFALPAIESAMAGVPLIAPTGTAFADYMSDEIGYPLEWEWEPVHGMDHLPYGIWYSPSTDWMKVKANSVTTAIKQAWTDMTTPCLDRGENTTVLKCKGRKAKEAAEKLSSEKIVTELYARLLNEIFNRKANNNEHRRING